MCVCVCLCVSVWVPYYCCSVCCESITQSNKQANNRERGLGTARTGQTAGAQSQIRQLGESADASGKRSWEICVYKSTHTVQQNDGLTNSPSITKSHGPDIPGAGQWSQYLQTNPEQSWVTAQCSKLLKNKCACPVIINHATSNTSVWVERRPAECANFATQDCEGRAFWSSRIL